jgi:hypothetical protein
MFSALSANDRLAAIAAVIVVITGVISLAWAWGALVLVPALAAVGVLFIVFQSRIAPTMTLPMTRGMLLLGLGGVAAIIWVVLALQWTSWIVGHLLTVDTIQFLIGLLAAIVMAFAGWRAYQAEKGTAPAAPTEAPPAPPAPPAA